MKPFAHRDLPTRTRAQVTPFSSIAQQNKGWVGFIQNTAMDAIHCIRFNRTESKDREMVQRRLREHVANPDRLPLLIFPEGTCVNLSLIHISEPTRH